MFARKKYLNLHCNFKYDIIKTSNKRGIKNMKTFLVITFAIVLAAMFWVETSNKPEYELVYKVLCAVMLWLIIFVEVFVR